MKVIDYLKKEILIKKGILLKTKSHSLNDDFEVGWNPIYVIEVRGDILMQHDGDGDYYCVASIDDVFVYDEEGDSVYLDEKETKELVEYLENNLIFEEL